MQNKLLSVLNTFVFLSKRSRKCLKTAETLSFEIQSDFLLAVQKLITQSSKWQNKEVPFEKLNRTDFESDESLILGYHELLHPNNFHAPAGFTPKLSFFPQIDFTGKKIMGLNCLGRAIALGILLKQHGYELKLGIRPCHAAVIVWVDKKIYYCDPQDDHVFELHSEIKHYKDYEWYETVAEDKLFSKFLVFHEFSAGILNAILGNLGFLQNSKHYDLSDENDRLLHSVRNLFDTSALDSIEWNEVQELYCPNLNSYKEKYKISYLLECERIKQRIYERSLQKKFDYIAYEACEKATNENMTKSKLNDFITVNMPIMKSYGRQIINSFETGCDFIHELPDSIIQYLSHIRMRIIENSELELYVLSKMKSKLL